MKQFLCWVCFTTSKICKQ